MKEGEEEKGREDAYIEFRDGEFKGVIRSDIVGISHTEGDGDEGDVELFTLA